MIKETKIGDAIFLEQRTYYFYENETKWQKNNPSAVTSDKSVFKLLKKIHRAEIKQQKLGVK